MIFDLQPCLAFSNRMICARIRNERYTIDKKMEDRDTGIIKECGRIMEINNLTKQIKDYGKGPKH